MKHKKKFVTLLLVAIVNFGHAQISGNINNEKNREYQVITNRHNVDLSVFHEQLKKCNFDAYRQYSTDRILHFSNGVTITLDSAEEIIASGRFIKISGITPANLPIEFPKTFEIDTQGNVTLKYDNTDPRAIKVNQHLKDK